MNDNYFSLLPGQTREIIMEFDPALLKGNKPKIVIKQFRSATDI